MLLRDTATLRLDLTKCLQVHHLIAEVRGGNLGHVSKLGSQDNVRVGHPEHKALFTYRKRLEVSWLLARWVVGESESEEARHHTLSSHAPEKLEEKEIALSLRKWPLDQQRNRNKKET